MTADQQRVVESARQVAATLYTGQVVAHRSCGVAVAETFGCPVRPYHVLRRGGLTGERECGAVRAGELVLATLLGSDDPAAALPEALATAIAEYRRLCRERLGAGAAAQYVCNDLTAAFADFQDPGRKQLCTTIAATVAATVAEVALAQGVTPTIAAVPIR